MLIIPQYREIHYFLNHFKNDAHLIFFIHLDLTLQRISIVRQADPLLSPLCFMFRQLFALPVLVSNMFHQGYIHILII